MVKHRKKSKPTKKQKDMLSKALFSKKPKQADLDALHDFRKIPQTCKP